MARVQKLNVILDIKESEVQRYLDLGYNVIGSKGEILQECVPNDLGTLRVAYIEDKLKIEQLEKENKQLLAKLKAKTKQDK